MTPQELAEIDQKVAEAIGLELAHHDYPFCAVTKSPHGHSVNTEKCDHSGWTTYYWQPSRDWNDAMFAAEKAGIEDMRLTKTSSGYELVVFNEWGDGRMHEWEESGPLAICDAILKLKGKE